MTDPIANAPSVMVMPNTVASPAASSLPQALITTDQVAPADAAKANPPDLHVAVAVLNQHAQDLQTSLHFRVDQITGQLVISVIDTQDNRVLMQVPGEEALAIAQSLEHLHMQLMKQSA